MSVKEIAKRYDGLAVSDCCLSCGGATDLAHPQVGEVCVDLGSGRGLDVIRIAEQVGETGFVYGIDISEGMMEKAKSNAKKLGVTNVEFIYSPLEKLNLPDKTVHLVVSNCTINHAADKEAVWSEIYRIMKNKGRFVVSDIYSTTVIPEKYSKDPVAIAECWAGAITKEEYLATLEKVGFKEVVILEESSPYPKGAVEVVSITISGKKFTPCSCGH